MAKAYEDIISVAEELGWKVTDLREIGFMVTTGVTQLEFEKYSPEGEDFSFMAEGRSPEELIEGIGSYSAHFNAEEHAAEWFENRDSVGGVPQSLRTLLEDADAIQNMLRELAEAVTYGKLVNQ